MFDQGSRAPVAISVLVRNPDAGHQGCRILYRDIGDYLTRERKLEMLREASSITGVEGWQKIAPDRHHDWIGQRDEAYQSLYPIGSKEAKAGRDRNVVFELHSQGYQTVGDSHLTSFSRDACAGNARTLVTAYSDALEVLEEHPEYSVDQATGDDTTKIRWSRTLKNSLRRRKVIAYSTEHLREVAYRPFVKKILYADPALSHLPGISRSAFPADSAENRAMCVVGVGSTKPFSILMVDVLPDLELISKGQCFPCYRYTRREESDLLDEGASLERIDNISDTALAAFRTRYGDPEISKDAVFDYAYGVLHAPDYRARFADDLSKTLPRIPFAPDFHAFAEAGRALAELHLGYETGPQYPLVPETADTSGQPPGRLFGTRSMRLVGEGDSVLIVNDRLRLSGIPADAHRYEVNGRTPLGWFIDRYRVTTDKESGIVNDPNAWFPDEASFIAAVCRIVHLSVETVRIIGRLPNALET